MKEGIMIVYLDNILIFTWILAKYYRAVHIFLEVLAKYNLYLCLKKCGFNKLYIEYLDLVIKDQVEMDPVKVARVHDWLIPAYYIKLQAFLCYDSRLKVSSQETTLVLE